MGGGMSIEMWLAEDDNAVFQSELQRNVFDEFARACTLDAGDISVSVDNHVVTLSGAVKSYPEKLEAERAAKRVRGVGAVRNDLAVMLPASGPRS
jgi:osmotically-inducible protein OsmY